MKKRLVSVVMSLVVLIDVLHRLLVIAFLLTKFLLHRGLVVDIFLTGLFFIAT